MRIVDQKLIFKESPHGTRKIIIATSIAETSITIKDVVYVIDSGKTKFEEFENVKIDIQTLDAEWVSLTNAKQRRDRASRYDILYLTIILYWKKNNEFSNYTIYEDRIKYICSVQD